MHRELDTDEFSESDYTMWLTNHTTAWAWGAFAYPDMTIFAPLGTLGEKRSLVADQIRAELKKRGEI